MSSYQLAAFAWLGLWVGATAAASELEPPSGTTPLLQRFCVECHGNEHQEAGLNLERLAAEGDFAVHFRQWRKAADMLEQEKMPPEDAPQLDQDQRRRLTSAIRLGLRGASLEHADDPGAVTMRRLTSAEYAYTIRDLTGLDLDVAHDFVGDAVGGEGFTNVGDVQFVQDSTLERFLAAARQVADHAVIGSGPLAFFHAPGATGLELSAIARIQEIYRAHGFRTAAGEGGEAFGLDRYSRAFFVAWQFQHRRALGKSNATLAALAAESQIDVRLAEYVRSVLTDAPRSFPTSEIVADWQALPTPGEGDRKNHERIEANVRSQCDRIQQTLFDWQSRLGENADAKEEARILSVESFDVSTTQQFEMNVNWPEGTDEAHLTFSVDPIGAGAQQRAAVIWRSPEIQFRIPDQVLAPPGPLKAALAGADAGRLKFSAHPRGGKVEPTDFVTTEQRDPTIALVIPEGARSAKLTVMAELDIAHGTEGIVRCSITQREETDQGKSVSALLANPKNTSFDSWKTGVLEFARLLPQVSQREPAPSDRDLIPPPFDGSYNHPERNLFHARIKYHRGDEFLVENMLDDTTRERLDRAWDDLLGSFDYHDAALRFMVDKYRLNLGGREIADLDAASIERLPGEPRKHIRRLHIEYHAIQKAFASAEAGHLEDVLRFADRAWRRPLDEVERDRLRKFYGRLRKEFKLDHRRAIRALLTRVLTAPDLIYRAERSWLPEGIGASQAAVAPDETQAAPLSDWEVASRLSYFLWSSLPDDELRRAAAAGELRSADRVARQAKRMLENPKARRLAAEFFGQWFGFYRFDRYRGVDPKRFPEFTDDLKAAMHDEAISFFEHVVRRDRPVREILFADYGFMNRELAAHYGLESPSPAIPSPDLPQDDSGAASRVDDLHRHHRGGLFGLGAVLTVTSAPQRTSPVKRGDWILRRVLGTPVPPPPADAGSLPGNDQFTNGLTVRQQLAAHQREASCRNCHARIDPLGFTLEKFDAVGRRREQYRNGEPIDTAGTLLDGTVISGLGGLRDYLAKHEKLFHRTLSTKLVGYAMGRNESICDAGLIEQMTAGLESDGRFSTLIDRIVRSRQFRYKRLGVGRLGVGPALETIGDADDE